MLCILKAIIAWIILIFAGGGIIRVLQRGLLPPFPLTDPTADPEVEKILRRSLRGSKRAHAAWIPVGVFLTCGYLFALYHFWNVGLAATALLLLIAATPRLVWRSPPSVSLVADSVLWGSSILVWYSLCKW